LSQAGSAKEIMVKLIDVLEGMKGGHDGSEHHGGEFDPTEMFKDYMDPERLNQPLLDAIPQFMDSIRQGLEEFAATEPKVEDILAKAEAELGPRIMELGVA
jgi:hypothetical protein